MDATLVILLLLAICSNGALAQNEPKKVECGKTKITCVCGIGDTKRYISVELKMYYLDDLATGKEKCAATEDPYQACANVSCLLSSSKSVSPLTKELISHFYPYEFTVPNGGVKHRFTRETGPCHVPSLNNAIIKCWKWPNWMNCDVNCIYGHAFKDGTETMNLNCRNTENVWKASGFKDCDSYLNCKVELVKPGEMKCKEPLDAPPYCEISCLDYDDNVATKRQKYECVDDSFGSNLPHCAILKNKVPLMRKPN